MDETLFTEVQVIEIAVSAYKSGLRAYAASLGQSCLKSKNPLLAKLMDEAADRCISDWRSRHVGEQAEPKKPQ